MGSLVENLLCLLGIMKSLAMTAAPLLPWPARVAGLTQASRVMPLVRSSEAASGIVTEEVVSPVKFSAEPDSPAAQVALAIVPVLLLKDESFRVVPVPSAKE